MRFALLAFIGERHCGDVGSADVGLCCPVCFVFLEAVSVWRQHQIQKDPICIACSPFALLSLCPLFSQVLSTIDIPLLQGPDKSWPDVNGYWVYLFPASPPPS